MQMKAGRELDALIAEKVMGWKFTKPTHGTCCTCQRCGRDQDTCFSNSCQFSGDIEPAWAVVEKLQEDGYSFSLSRGTSIKEEESVTCGWWAAFGWSGRVGESAPLAICYAALMAVTWGDMQCENEKPKP